MQQLLRALDQRIPVGLVVLDHDLIVRHVNAYMSAQTLISPETAIGQHFASVFSVANADKLGCTSGQCRICQALVPIPDDPLAPVEINVTTADGHTKQLHSLMCCPFRDETGNKHYGLLFYDPDAAQSAGFHHGLKNALRDIRSVRDEQRRLVAQIEHGHATLIHSEKLAIIGKMAAGVAHEINNPIGYVFSNLRTLARYVDDLLKIIDAVDVLQDIEDIRRLKRTLDYAYMRDDIEALIAESGEGIDRVKSIISALQDFYHIDEEAFSQIDLHRCLDTTINVAANETRYKAEIVKEYSALPAIECNASQINQVVLNLLVNAGQAISNEGTITVRTGMEGEDVWFEVEDTGAGIEPENIEKLFEPFFTTKGVGQGTGLGLALSYSIIQKHHGRMQVFSEPGQGTRFRVWLPISQTSVRKHTE